MSSEIPARRSRLPPLRRCCGARWRRYERSAGEIRHGDAEREAARKLDQARREAYAEGAGGRPPASRRANSSRRRKGWRRTLAALARLRESIREETIQDLVHLAISIAARVIHREVAVDPDALAGLIKAAFSKLQSREINRVRMHPTLEALVRKLLEQCRRAQESGAGCRIRASSPREVFFETSQGILDASVDTQLREIERGLIDKLETTETWPPLSSSSDLGDPCIPQVPDIEVLPWIGEVTEMVGLLIASRGPVVSIGDFVEVRTASGRSIRSQVIGFRNDRVLSHAARRDGRICSPAIA